ncbi:MAG: helix-turn-helix domain-containing protein [Clostridiaceae bacterium]
MNIGCNIKHNRKLKGLTQENLAKTLYVTTATIQNYENNRRQPKYETLENIASALGVSINDLMFSEEESISRRFFNHFPKNIFAIILSENEYEEISK